MTGSRPATIAELADRALTDLWDPAKDLKYWLRAAQKLRNDAKALADRGALEDAFIQYARSATIVLEKLPQHPDYGTLLTAQQKGNLALVSAACLSAIVRRSEANTQNGQDILDSLSKLKPALVEQHERWVAEQSGGGEMSPPSHAYSPQPEAYPSPAHHDFSFEDEPPPGTEEIVIPPRWNPADDGLPAALDALHVGSADSARGRWAHLQDDREPHASARRALARADSASRPRADSTSRRRDSIARRQREPGPERARSPPHPQLFTARSYGHALGDEHRRPASRGAGSGEFRPASRGWDDAPRARALGPAATMPAFGSSYDEGPYSRGPTPAGEPPAHAYGRPLGGAASFGPTSFPDYTPAPGLAILPLESPAVYESDTDRSTDGEGPGGAIAIPVPRRHGGRRPSYPAPMTTTSPAPHAPLRYPSLMSLHQREQGYKPSAKSMFVSEAPDYYDGSPGSTGSPGTLHAGTPRSYQALADRVVPSPPADIRAPWPPAPAAFDPHQHPQQPPHLKTVTLPRECLPRFLSIAAVNTAANRETCGLLLGKDRGHKFAVTTLLVPRQRATADTCAMEEEELVLQFTEERGLITLGWIHTHPTQSCFMSSLDLHTHAGFQRMLPESFAIVCAPLHTPKCARCAVTIHRF
jgi:STAM-binding protein